MNSARDESTILENELDTDFKYVGYIAGSASRGDLKRYVTE
jgi:hypothetical protein